MYTQNEGSPARGEKWSNGLRELADASFGSARQLLGGNISAMESIGGIIGRMLPGASKKADDCDCCAPKTVCPPRCLLQLTRTAYERERILVHFKVRNTHQVAKNYRIGVRPLKDEHGNTPASQPVLSKTAVLLAPGESQTISMTIDLSSDYLAGHVYSTLVVIREKDINQNICFSLLVKSYENIPEALPRDEQKPLRHFQNWQSHFYCAPVKQAEQAPEVINVKQYK